MTDEKPMTASDFIRKQPLGMKANEVIRAAKAAGFDPSSSLVYVIRSQMRAKADPSRKAQQQRDVDAFKVMFEPHTTPERERQLMGLAAELGLARSRELLDSARERIKAAL